MSRRSSSENDGRARSTIDLAHEPPFDIAHLTVTPAALCLEAGEWKQRLEPRAMQVLVVLAQAAPAVVGREELNERVWSGRIVGEDAINRAVQTLRRVAGETPTPAPFIIETVPRVGYRLRAGETAEARPSPDRPVRGETGSDADSIAGPGEVAARPSSRTPAGIGVRLALAALVVVTGVAAWRGLGSDAAASSSWTISGAAALTGLPLDARELVLSPDARRLAYRAADASGQGRIFVRELKDGGLGSPVSPATLDARRPAWSPDGAKLAFIGYDAARPCRLFVVKLGSSPKPAGECETARDPRLALSADGGSLLFGDSSGENAVLRISAVKLDDGTRTVLTNPPADSLGDTLPTPLNQDLIFHRQFGWADEAWIARDMTSGRERVLWRRRGMSGSVAAPLPDGSLMIAWTRAGASGLDVVGPDGRVAALPPPLGPVLSMSFGGERLLVETDRSESALARASETAANANPLVTVRGRIMGPILLSGDRLRFPVTWANASRIWERDPGGMARPWGTLTAARIHGLMPSNDGRLTAALATGNAGREIVLLDARGVPIWRWLPRARSLNPAAWTADGRGLIAPVLDGAGWRLVGLDPFGGEPPRDLGLPGFAGVQSHGRALYAVRAGETTGIRELWRLDGGARRLPIDLTLFDIMNWRAVAEGVWLPDRSVPGIPRLVLRDPQTGRVLRSVAAPGLAGAGAGLAADARGPVYVRTARDAPEHGLLTLAPAPRGGGIAQVAR